MIGPDIPGIARGPLRLRGLELWVLWLWVLWLLRGPLWLWVLGALGHLPAPRIVGPLRVLGPLRPAVAMRRTLTGGKLTRRPASAGSVGLRAGPEPAWAAVVAGGSGHLPPSASGRVGRDEVVAVGPATALSLMLSFSLPVLVLSVSRRLYRPAMCAR